VAAWVGCSAALRAFTFGHVCQLDAVDSQFLPRLSGQAPILAGRGADGVAGLDDSVIQTSGYAKQAAGRGYTGVKGLNALVATASTPLAAPVIAATRLLRGNARSFGERPPWSPRRCRSPAAVEPVDRLFFAPIRRSIPAPWSPRPTRPEPDSVSPPRSTHR
jgi:hypothetical protein